MNPARPDVSVVIVNWNVGDLLVECLRSLTVGLGDVRAEIVVVDNASVDRSVELVQREFPFVRVIVNKENVGFSRANNLAIKESEGRYVLLLNPDTVVFSDTVEKLVRFMDDTPNAGIAGCKQVYANGKWQSTCHRMISLKREAIVALGLSKIFPQWVDYGDLPLTATEPFRVDWVGGACLIIRRDLMERVGLLDDNLFMYAEDADLCQRVRNQGYSVYYLPDVSIVHHRGQSASRSSESLSVPGYSMLMRQFGGKRYVIKKHYGNLSANAYLGVIIVEVVRRLLQDSLKSLFPHPHFPKSALMARRRDYLAVLRATLKGKI